MKRDIVGQTIQFNDKNYTVVGVIKDMIMESPYKPITPTVFLYDPNWANVITVAIKHNAPVKDALSKIEKVFKKYNPGAPFDYTFNDEDYAKKFADEQRVGNLATFFTILAIFISCLGLFGLASFVAEQRKKEIGVRKVLGASMYNLWQMLSREFALLVIISCFIAIPLAWYYLNSWLKQYDYRTTYHCGYLFFQDRRTCNNINNSKLSSNKSSNCKSREELENRIIHAIAFALNNNHLLSCIFFLVHGFLFINHVIFAPATYLCNCCYSFCSLIYSSFKNTLSMKRVPTFKVCLFTGILLFASVLVRAQTKVITGKVTDSAGNALVGATVKIKNSAGGTSTDASGNFTITVPDSLATLIVSYTGMQTQQIPVVNKTNINVQLNASNSTLR